ncbi:hypothetical protein [Evansella halocellulosilytica]|uniref:hypothetical protein n=1 Tax=Evansella halocellulosilytica TaxID=2011013 RepID=UPI000BB7398B|nr:hypothetical protein [Evansella halocellulosilytica]
MRKSDLLDQLRLEVGLAYDYSANSTDFMKKVLNAIYTTVNKKCMISIYQYNQHSNTYRRTFLLENGERTNTKEHFGLGFIKVCHLQASILLKKNGEQATIAPVYEDGILKYAICFNILESDYPITNQDLEFVNEVVRFIEAKRLTF